MSTHRTPRPLLLVAGIALAWSAHAAESLTKDAYEAAKERIAADHKSARQACDQHMSVTKNVCAKQADARAKIARAELEYRASGKDADRLKAMEVRAEQEYDVAMVRCDERIAAAKEACEADAKAVRKRAQVTIESMRRSG